MGLGLEAHLLVRYVGLGLAAQEAHPVVHDVGLGLAAHEAHPVVHEVCQVLRNVDMGLAAQEARLVVHDVRMGLAAQEAHPVVPEVSWVVVCDVCLGLAAQEAHLVVHEVRQVVRDVGLGPEGPSGGLWGLPGSLGYGPCSRRTTIRARAASSRHVGLLPSFLLYYYFSPLLFAAPRDQDRAERRFGWR
ncbi:hypothetical protein AMTR_s00033p00148100 [Amborella trichopoda]|uniref:Uncharacterized protein n=1 Tax=Amborella trichopoda TaxID=13333 RepID=U5CYM9_AMBTC|nr:hypothetical protein AMTR_s00033p00148100 [Amborella trichopoda]